MLIPPTNVQIDFLSHCKWVSVKLTEWVDHTAVPRVVLLAEPRAPSSRYWHRLPVPMTSFLCMPCLLIRHLELKHLAFHQACRSCTYQPSCLTDHTWRAVSEDTPLEGSQHLVLSKAAPRHSLFRSLLSCLLLPPPHLHFLASFSLQSFEVWIYESFPREAL